MQTKLGLFCDRFIEAGWLAAVVAVPTLFNVYTARNFDLHKAPFVRSLALLIVLAWTVGMVERWKTADDGRKEIGLRGRTARMMARPLVLPALLMVCVTLLSTLTSIWPHGSLWGTYERLQGAFTTLSYVAIGLLIRGRLRTQVQIERLTTLIVLGSLPVCLYALAQHLGQVPAPFVGQFGSRVSSSLGNPIFLAAYLIMVIPLTIRQLVPSLHRLVAGETNLPSGLSVLAMYAALLVSQLYVVLLTQSRGPVLALSVGLIIFFVLWALQEDRRAVGWAVIGVAVLAGSLLAAVNLSDPLSATVHNLPYVGRLTTIAGAAELEQRTLIWQAAVELVGESPLRFLLGYGPDSMHLAFYRRYPPRFAEFEGLGSTADRSHSILLDVLVTTGLIGTIAYVFLICSVLYYGLRALGLADAGRQRRILAGLLTGGGVAGTSLSCLIGGLRFAGAGVSGGLLVGLFAYLALFLAGVLERGEREGGQRLLLIACLSAIVGHFVEIQVGIPTTTTNVLFWMLAAVLAVAATCFEGGLSVQSSHVSPPNSSALQSKAAGRSTRAGHDSASPGISLMPPDAAPVVASGLMVGLLLITTAFGFVTHLSDLTSDPFAVPFLLLVWFWAGLIVVGEASVEASKEGRTPSSQLLSFTDRVFVYAVPSLLSLLAFVLSHVLILRGFPAITGIAIAYYVWCLASLMLAAMALLGATPLPERFWSGNRGWIYPVWALVVLGLILTSNLNLVRADICRQLGRFYAQSNRWNQSVAFYERAVNLAPAQDSYYVVLSEAYFRMAQSPTPDSPHWFQKSRGALEEAVELSPLNPNHRANLGNMHHAWADVTDDPRQQAELLPIALEHYQESVSLAPQTHGRLLEQAIFEAHVSLAMAYGRLGQFDDALKQARAARDSAPPGREQEAQQLIAMLEGMQP